MKPLVGANKFYETLGTLFYAIAAAEKTVKQEEIDELKRLIEADWKPFSQSFKKAEPNDVVQIQLTFDNLNKQVALAKNSMDQFKMFKRKNENLFSEETKKLIWKTCSNIASAVASNNKSELVMLSVLSFALRE